MVLNEYLLGFVEDNVGFFTMAHLFKNLPSCTHFVGFPTGYCFDQLFNNQPIISVLSFLIAKISGPILSYNLIVVIGMVLNYLFAFRFFNKLYGKFISSLLSLVFLASPYLSYQSRSHLDLIQIWPGIWFLETLFFRTSRDKGFRLGLILALATGFSNYLGYFIILFCSFYLLTQILLSRDRKSKITRNFKYVLESAVVFILATASFLAPYLITNYLHPKVRLGEATDYKAVNRPLEDFVLFSSRPWYYILPPVDNQFFGRFTQNSLDWISQGGNYLTKDYFKSEHSASYLGWANLLIAFASIIVIIRRKHNPTFSNLNFRVLAVTNILLIIFTMPPIITVSGITLYTPSYILFSVFPMFRVLSRLGGVILFSTLVFTGYGYYLIKTLFEKRLSYATVRIILIFLALVSITEFFIPLKISHVGKPPKIYSFIGSLGTLETPLVVYPYDKTDDALFWINVHQQPVINPHSYENRATSFQSENFTNNLVTSKGLEEARNLGAVYLIHFYNNNNVDFPKTTLLEQVGMFEEKDPSEKKVGIALPFTNAEIVVFRIVETGSTVSNSAILYKFR